MKRSLNKTKDHKRFVSHALDMKEVWRHKRKNAGVGYTYSQNSSFLGGDAIKILQDLNSSERTENLTDRNTQMTFKDAQVKQTY